MKKIWQFLGFTRNTIGRRRYVVANITASFGLLIVTSLLMSLLSSLFEDEPVILYPLIILYITSVVFALIVHIKTSIRRVRDIGIARSWWVLAIIPLINIPFIIFLCLKKGGGENIQGFTDFWQETYPPKLRKILFGILIFGLAGTLIVSGYQHSTIDQRVAERKTQIGQEREQKELRAKNYYDECLQGESKKPKGQFYFSPCFQSTQLPLETEYQYDKQLRGLEELKGNLESGFYYLIVLLCFTIIVVAIPTIRLAIFVSRLIWNKSRAATSVLRSESKQMSSFQQYSLILSVLILVTLIVVVILLI